MVSRLTLLIELYVSIQTRLLCKLVKLLKFTKLALFFG